MANLTETGLDIMSADAVTFRIATLGDVPELATARWAFRAEAGETPMESEATFAVRYEAFLEDALRSGRWTFWIAETTNGTLVAHMAVCVVQSIPRPSRMTDQWGYLTDCFTHPAFRNRRIGRELLAHVAEWARALDLEMLIVWPSEKSHDFYARAGFGPADEIRVLRLRDYDTPPDPTRTSSAP